MQKPECEDEVDRGRPQSRRSSVCVSRRSSVDKAPSSTSSTPKKTQRQANFDFVVTGKQILKKSDRANSLPGSCHRRQSADSLLKKRVDSPKKLTSQAKSRDASLDDDLSLELSQVSDFEDTNFKYGIKKFTTSTPKKVHRRLIQSVLTDKHNKSLESRSKESSFSKESYQSSASPYRHAMSTELESSTSPVSAPSSGDSAPGFPDTLMSSRSQDLLDSCCVSTWQESESKENGEWNNFWANYNNSLARVPLSRYYEQCPTPYRTEDFDVTEFDLSNEGLKRSPEDINTINNIIRNEGLHLTPRETQSIIKCTHILGNMLTKAIERQAKERDCQKEKIQEVAENSIDPEKELKKKSMSLNLKETVLPLDVKEEKRWESVPTQTDISLPNTKSAPKIFEKILRQLSKSSIDEKIIRENSVECNEEAKSNGTDVKE